MPQADLILRGGPVYTGVSTVLAEAVAVSGDKILAVGSRDRVAETAGPSTRTVDLGGSLAMPGFIDAHVHLVDHGFTMMKANCKFPNVHSIFDIQECMREQARKTPAGEWVLGWGYDHLKLAEKRHPNRYDLDTVCADRPVAISRTCYHIAVVNSKVLEMFGITKNTPDPVGGKYDRDEDGVPNGVLRENAMNAIAGMMKQTHENTVLATAAGAKDFLSYGITSVHDAGTTPASMRALVDVIDEGKVPLRVYAMVGCGDFEYMRAHIASAVSTGFGNERLKLGAFKLMTDGSSSGPTCATRAPYAHDPSNRGILYLTQDQINEWFCSAGEARWQLTAHAVGDRAIDMVISGIERSMELHSRRDARHRIEHCAMAWDDIRKRIRRLGIVPCMQPTFMNEFGDGYVQSYGPVRASGMFPAASCIREGIPFAMGTDCPVTFCDPMLNVYSATTRRTMNGNVVGFEEAISLEEALHAYTVGGAYAAHEEAIKGSLEPDKLADIVVLDGNPFAVDPAEYKTMRARITIVGGKVAFER